MSTPLCQFGKPHSTWSFVRDNPTDVQKAAIKTRILTGCYTLQANRSKFNQYNVDPTCPICNWNQLMKTGNILFFNVHQLRESVVNIYHKIRNFINESDKNLDLENIETLLQLIIDPIAFYHEKRHLPNRPTWEDDTWYDLWHSSHSYQADVSIQSLVMWLQWSFIW
jgi:hypothetical protein